MAPSAMRTNVDVCPDLEVLGAYLEGRLSERERAEIAAHLAECETCYFVFTEAAQMRVLEAAVPASPSLTGAAPQLWTAKRVLWSSAAGLAVAASLLIAVGTGIVPIGRRESSQFRALVVAVSGQRTIEGRLTGGFTYGPLFSIRGGPRPIVSPQVRIAAAEIEKSTADSATASALRDRGIAQLIIGDVERAIDALENAASQRPDDARIQSDLSAAYLARANNTSDADDLTKALASANRAINLNHSLPEAVFNRALALERRAMINDARDAWQAYLALDDKSGWADDARNHLRAMSGGR